MENIPSMLYYGGSDDTNLSSMGVIFDTPKVVEVSKKVVGPLAKDDDIIIDFFAGSATTAHAVMQLNAEDNGNRKFIMVQLPEVCDERSEAFKAGYKTIAEISKERIRRAGKKIKEELVSKEVGKKEKDQLGLFNKGEGEVKRDLDVGFRVLKVDTTNMKDVYYNPDSIKQGGLFNYVDNIKEDRSEEDLLFQVLLDWGTGLTLPIQKDKIQGKNVFFVDQNALVTCFASNGEITEDFCKELAGRKPLRVVFRDSGFKDDSVKINVEQIFKLMSPKTEIRSI